MEWSTRRPGTAVLAVVLGLLALTACDNTEPAETTTTETVAEVACGSLLREFVDDLQAYVDQFAGLTTGDLINRPESPSQIDLNEAMESFTSHAVAAGCSPVLLEFLLPSELDRLTADGNIAQVVLTSLIEQITGEAGPDPAALLPETRRVSADEDLAAVVDELGPGSTIRLGPGTHSLSQPLVILRPLTLVGEGPDSTQIVSSAGSAAIVFLGDGRLTLEGLELTHTGAVAASLLVIRSGSADIARTRFRNAVATDETGGSGVVLASDTSSGSVEPTTIVDSEFLGNASAGIVVTGAETPIIRTSTFVDNGRCAICLFDQAAGSISDNRMSEHDVGVIAAASTSPVLAGNVISDNRSAGIVYEEASGGSATGNTISGNGDVGILVNGDCHPKIERNDISGHDASGIAIAGNARPVIERNEFTDNGTAIEVGGASVARVDGNTIDGAIRAGVLIGQSAKGLFVNNSFVGDMPSALQIQDDAQPTLRDNTLRITGLVGLLYLGSAAGEAIGNDIEGPSIGIQIGDESAPSLQDNEISTEEAAVVFNDSASGAVAGTTCVDASFGIVLLDSADPDVGDNDCAVLDQRG